CGSEPTWHPCDRIGREQTSGDADSGSAQCQNNARDKPGDEPTVGERLPEPPKAKTLRRKSEVPRGGDGARCDDEQRRSDEKDDEEVRCPEEGAGPRQPPPEVTS